MKYSTIITCLGIFIFWAQNAGAQDCSQLSPSNTGSGILAGLLGDDAQSIDGACQLATGDDYYSARLAYNGYDDKEYKLIGELLDANRRKVPGCDPVAMSLKGKPTSADLTFTFDAGAEKFAVPNISVRYLKVTIVASDDPLSDLALGGLTLTGTSAEYRIDHKFRVGSTGEDETPSNVTVSITFSPVGRAATIKQ